MPATNPSSAPPERQLRLSSPGPGVAVGVGDRQFRRVVRAGVSTLSMTANTIASLPDVILEVGLNVRTVSETFSSAVLLAMSASLTVKVTSRSLTIERRPGERPRLPLEPGQVRVGPLVAGEGVGELVIVGLPAVVEHGRPGIEIVRVWAEALDAADAGRLPGVRPIVLLWTKYSRVTRGVLSPYRVAIVCWAWLLLVVTRYCCRGSSTRRRYCRHPEPHPPCRCCVPCSR